MVIALALGAVVTGPALDGDTMSGRRNAEGTVRSAKLAQEGCTWFVLMRVSDWKVLASGLPARVLFLILALSMCTASGRSIWLSLISIAVS